MSLRLLFFSIFLSSVAAMNWRIFVGREDCITESIPENQLTLLKESFKRRKSQLPEKLNVAIDVGFLISNRYGGETTRGTVDVTARDPNGEVIYSSLDVKEDAFSVVGRGKPEGWEVCFRIAHTEGSTQPLMVELSYFTVNMRALVGTEHEKSKEAQQIESALSLDIDPESLAKSEDLSKVLSGLRSSNMQLTTVRQMGHHLKMRTERHMRTVKSTHRRTLYWSFIVAVVVVSASIIQVIVVQRFFGSTNTMNRV